MVTRVHHGQIGRLKILFTVFLLIAGLAQADYVGVRADDQLEPNDTIADATDLLDAQGVLYELKVRGNPDYFMVETTEEEGNLSLVVGNEGFNGGNIEVEVQNEDGGIFDSFVVGPDIETTAVVTGLEPGIYFILIVQVEAATELYYFSWERLPVESDSGGGCFIATAAYGTPMGEKLGTLRAIRDSYMLNNAVGEAFVDSYYRLSPPVADVIAKSPALKAITRTMLTPVVWISTIHLRWGSTPLMLLAALGFLLAFHFRHKHKLKYTHSK